MNVLLTPVTTSQERADWCAMQDSNSGINADNQELTTQASQRDSQNPSIIADAELQRVIEAWGKLPANLKTAIMAIVGSSNFHG